MAVDVDAQIARFATTADGERLGRRVTGAMCPELGEADADDIASVLHYRLEQAVTRLGAGSALPRARFIVGLLPEAVGEMSADMRAALDERRELIEARAAAIIDTALERGEQWVIAVGAAPENEQDRARWRSGLMTIAAYRDRHSIDPREAQPLGAEPESIGQRIDYERAGGALIRAQQIARQTAQSDAPRPTAGREHRGPTR